MDTRKDNKKDFAEREYAGTAVDTADNNHVTATEVKQETAMLNNNHAGDDDRSMDR